MVIRSGRRWFWAALAALGMAVIVAVVLGAAQLGRTTPSLTLSAATAFAFLGYLFVRSLLARVVLTDEGGVYHGLLRNRAWRWRTIRGVGRQTSFAFGANGNAPELTGKRGLPSVVLVALADPQHPDREDALIARLQAALDAAAPPAR